MTMAKRARKEKLTDAERAEREADRLAAHERSAPQMTHDEAVQGANLASGVPDPILGANTQTTEFEDNTGEEVENEASADLDAEGVVEGSGEEPKAPVSIVKDKFKKNYAENAAAIGDNRKQVKRSNWDWLAQQLAAACLSEKGKIEIGAFQDILDANGIDHSRWTNKNKGWEGRFRMTGRVALQKVVATQGVLKTPAGTELEAPAEWCAKYAKAKANGMKGE
jgi:hypothetical protein